MFDEEVIITYEAPVWISGVRFPNLWLQRDREEVNEWRRRIHELQLQVGKKEDVFWGALQLGLPLLEAKLKSQASEEDMRIAQELNKKRIELNERKAKFAQYGTFVRDMGLEEFTKWAVDARLPLLDEFLAEKHAYAPEVKQAVKDEQWLKQHLDGRGPVHTDSVKEAAKADGVIADETGWGRLRQRASKLGMTGGLHAHWQYDSNKAEPIVSLFVCDDTLT